jgi:hypothetical protein
LHDLFSDLSAELLHGFGDFEVPEPDKPLLDPSDARDLTVVCTVIVVVQDGAEELTLHGSQDEGGVDAEAARCGEITVVKYSDNESGRRVWHVATS